MAGRYRTGVPLRRSGDLTSKLDANFEVGIPLSVNRYDTGDERRVKAAFGLARTF